MQSVTGCDCSLRESSAGTAGRSTLPLAIDFVRQAWFPQTGAHEGYTFKESAAGHCRSS